MSHTAPPFDPAEEPRPDADDSRPLRELLRLAGRPCSACAGRCSAFEIVWSIALGFKEAPRCLSCLSEGLGRDEDELRKELANYVHRRECYRRAWNEAGRMEASGSPVPTATRPANEAPASPALTSPAHDWDAGDMGCGDLVLALRIRLNALAPGDVIRVRATDPAAPEDIPAWCRLCGHSLVSADHPFYFICRKGA
jgi:tRNA 2-thiouridine synthesizing protein A